MQCPRALRWWNSQGQCSVKGEGFTQRSCVIFRLMVTLYVHFRYQVCFLGGIVLEQVTVTFCKNEAELSCLCIFSG